MHNNNGQFGRDLRLVGATPEGPGAFGGTMAPGANMSIVIMMIPGRVSFLVLILFTTTLVVVFGASTPAKRDTSAAAASDDALELNGMTFGLRTLAGETNSLKFGENIHYKLEIALPKGPSDLLLEVHTLDSPASANRTSLSLYNFTMPYQSIGLVFNQPRAKFHLSNKTANVFDRMTVDFGSIKNNGPERNTLIICFSVVLVRKPKRAKKKHTVAVGVEFGKGQTELAWVAQSEITTASLLQKDDQTFFEANFTMAPETIPIGSAVTYRLDGNLQFRSDYVRIDINKSATEYEPDNLVSLGLITVTGFGRNFQAIPLSPRHYRGYRNHTASPYSYSISTLDMDLITNNGEPKSRTFLKHPENSIGFAFSIYALDYDENVGRNFSITIRVQIGKGRTFFHRTLNITIGARNKNEKIQSLLASSHGNFTTGLNVITGGITVLKIKSRFDDGFKTTTTATTTTGQGNGIFVDYSVELEIDSFNQFIPCAGRLINEESGINIPYVNPRPIKPITTDLKKKFIFYFGRLNFVKLISNSNNDDNDNDVDVDVVGDNDLTAEIIFRASFAAGNDNNDDANNSANGTTAAAAAAISVTEIKAITINGQRSVPLMIEKNGLSIEKKAKDAEDETTKMIQINSVSSVPWNDLIVNGGIAINVRLDFQPNTAYQDLSLEIVPDDPTIININRLKICRFSVVKVSEKIPCTCVERDTINQKNVFYYNSGEKEKTKSFFDRATINFGSISVANTSQPSSSLLSSTTSADSIETTAILTNFVLTTIVDNADDDGNQQKKSETIPIKINVIDGKEKKFSDIMNLNISSIIPTVIQQPVAADTDQSITVSGIDFDIHFFTEENYDDDNKRSIIPGLSEQILIDIHIPPYSMGPLTIQVEETENEVVEQELENVTISATPTISICGLWIHRIGYNMPCIDNRTAETGYEFTDFGLNRRAVISFASITNFGSQIRKSTMDERRDNALEFITMIRVLEQQQQKNRTSIKITVNYGPHVRSKEFEIPITETNGAMDDPKAVARFSEPVEITLKPAPVVNGGERSMVAYHGVPKLFHFDMKLDRNSQTALSILMEPSNQFKMCNAAMVKVGRNYPCYSPFTLKVLPNQFDLGIICHTQLYPAEQDDEDWLRLAFALRPSHDRLQHAGQMKVAGAVYRGPIPINRKFELSLTMDNSNDTTVRPEIPLPEKAAKVDPVVPGYGFKIRERKWLPFRVRIPAFSTGPLSVMARGQADQDRAILVVYDLRIVSAGQNIPCPFENRPHIERNSTTGNGKQLNQLYADLGYYSNFGFTYQIDSDYNNNNNNKNETSNNEPEEEHRHLEDDSIRMEILAELTDHPGLIEEEKYHLQVETIYGKKSSKTEMNIHLDVRPDEPDVRLDVIIRNRKRMPILDRNDTFMIMATIKHLPESNAEPINVALRMFTPNFAEIIKVNWANIEPLPEKNGTTDLLFPQILFNEEISVNFTIQIDPKNIRGYGRDEITNLAPFRMICEHHQRSLKFPCSRMKFISFRSMSSECTGPLGMENGEILDEQISASTAISERFHPKYVRPKSKGFWSPAIRNWPSDPKRRPYIQIDFRRPTRLVRVEFHSVPGMRKVTSFHVDFSHDGKVWYSSNSTGNIVHYQDKEVGESQIIKPIESRFIRFVIDSIDSLKNSKNQYLAVKFELYGCYLERNQNEEEESLANRSAPSTHLTDDPEVKNRHISVDPYTNVIYFCDQSTSDEQYYLCYHSDSGGNSWTVIGRSIDMIQGFELATGKFYGIDFDRPAYFYSGDGINWTPIDWESYNSTVTHGKFQKKLLIPRFNKQDMEQFDVRRGNWRASYDGLNYEDYQYPKAYWTKCCGLD